jgi:hypothetical protein
MRVIFHHEEHEEHEVQKGTDFRTVPSNNPWDCWLHGF